MTVNYCSLFVRHYYQSMLNTFFRIITIEIQSYERTTVINSVTIRECFV